MSRFNKGRNFEDSTLRLVVIESEQAFIRVIVEVLWQLCAWLDMHDCRKKKNQFFTHMIRFEDVIPNYFNALYARLVVDEDSLREWKDMDWPNTIDKADKVLSSYILWLKRRDEYAMLPETRRGIDYFLNDQGLNAILAAA